MDNNGNSGKTLDGIASDIRYIQRDIEAIQGTLRHQYVTREEFEPIKKLVYGLVSLILVSVVGALLVTIIK